MDGIACPEPPLASPGNYPFLIHKSSLGNFVVLRNLILLSIADWSKGEDLMQANLIRNPPSAFNKIQKPQKRFLLDGGRCMTSPGHAEPVFCLRDKVPLQPAGMRQTPSSWDVSLGKDQLQLTSGSTVAQKEGSPLSTVIRPHLRGFQNLSARPSTCVSSSCCGSLRTKRVPSNRQLTKCVIQSRTETSLL